MLLDTCTLIWLTGAPSRLSASASKILDDHGQIIHVSAITAWEIALKASKGKIGFGRPVSEWFAAVVARYALRELPVTAAVAMSSCELPPMHADPFDRLLVATALAHGLAIITPDPWIVRYPGLKTIW